MLHYLTAWQCPQQLLARMLVPAAALSSRVLLLVLGWLTVRSGVLTRALQRHATGADSLVPLPPFTQVRAAWAWLACATSACLTRATAA